MLNSFRISKTRITRWTLILTGLFLILSGSPLASFSTGNVQPYLTMGASLIILGFVFILVLAALVNGKISLRQTQVSIGLSGQALLGIVIFEIPFVPSVVQSPYNFHTYSIVLGILGIAISIVSVITISRFDKKTEPFLDSKLNRY